MSDQSIDFRAVSAILFRARIDDVSLALQAGRLRLVIRPAGAEPARPVALVFDGVSDFRWRSGTTDVTDPLELSVVGLERLAADDVWRLYAVPVPGAVLELSCRAVSCDGREVSGVGRSFHDRSLRP